MAGKLKALQQWCKVRCDGYRDVEITNFTTSWKSGLAFCAIIHRYRPDLIDYDSLRKENTYENSKLAFDVAYSLGIPALLEADDMVTMTVPDKLCIITYVSQYYNYFHNKPQEGGPGVKRAGTKRQQPSLSDRTPNIDDDTGTPVKVSAISISSKHRGSNDSLGGAKRSTMEDRCHICHEKVYLLERHYTAGRLCHRKCLRDSEREQNDRRHNKENISSTRANNTPPLARSTPKSAAAAEVVMRDRNVILGTGRGIDVSQQAYVPTTKIVSSSMYLSTNDTPLNSSSRATASAVISSAIKPYIGQSQVAQPQPHSSVNLVPATSAGVKYGSQAQASVIPFYSSSNSTSNNNAASAVHPKVLSPIKPYSSPSQAAVTQSSILGSVITTLSVLKPSPALSQNAAVRASAFRIDPSAVSKTTSHDSTHQCGANIVTPSSNSLFSINGATSSSSRTGNQNMVTSVTATVTSASPKQDFFSVGLGSGAAEKYSSSYTSTPTSLAAAAYRDQISAKAADMCAPNKYGISYLPTTRPTIVVRDNVIITTTVGLIAPRTTDSCTNGFSSSGLFTSASIANVSKPGGFSVKSVLATASNASISQAGGLYTSGVHSGEFYGSATTSRAERNVTSTTAGSVAKNILSANQSSAANTTMTTTAVITSRPTKTATTSSVAPISTILKTSSNPPMSFGLVFTINSTTSSITAPQRASASAALSINATTKPRYVSVFDSPKSSPVPAKRVVNQAWNPSSASPVTSSAKVSTNGQSSPVYVLRSINGRTTNNDQTRETNNNDLAKLAFKSKPAGDGNRLTGDDKAMVTGLLQSLAAAKERKLQASGDFTVQNKSVTVADASLNPAKDLGLVTSSRVGADIGEKNLSVRMELVASEKLSSSTNSSSSSSSSQPVMRDFTKPAGLSQASHSCTENAIAKSILDTRPNNVSETKPSWQLEAEKRIAARNGNYIDPEKQRVSVSTVSQPVQNYTLLRSTDILPASSSQSTNPSLKNIISSPGNSPLVCTNVSQWSRTTATTTATTTSPSGYSSVSPGIIPPVIISVPKTISIETRKPEAWLDTSVEKSVEPVKKPMPVYAQVNKPKLLHEKPTSVMDHSNDHNIYGSTESLDSVVAGSRYKKQHTPGIGKSPLVKQMYSSVESLDKLGATKVTRIVPGLAFTLQEGGALLPSFNDTTGEVRQWLETNQSRISGVWNVPMRQVNAEKRVAMALITNNLQQLDDKLRTVEAEGRLLEEQIRSRTDEAMDDEQDTLMISWFRLVKQRYELVRDESELIYKRRQQELEDLHGEVEYQYRCLMHKPDFLKTEDDKQLEESLLDQLLETVGQRNSIVDSMEVDRLRYEEEDRTIEDMLHATGFTETVLKTDKKHGKDSKSAKKQKKENKKKKSNTDDVDGKPKKPFFRRMSSKKKSPTPATDVMFEWM